MLRVMDHKLLGQICGVIAVIIAISSFQFDNRRTMLKLALLASVFYVIAFASIGATTGAIMNAINGLRYLTFLVFSPTRKNSWLLGLFIVIPVIATAVTWQGPKSLLAMAGTILISIAFWQTDERIIRILSLTAPPLWFIYDAMVGFYPGMFVEVFDTVSILVGRYRFDRKPKK